jgi:para-aminobenzoate synthetase component 1
MTLIQKTAEKMNALGSQHIPFLFVIDFQMQQPIVMPLNEINQEEIQFCIHGKGNQTNEAVEEKKEIVFTFQPPDFQLYKKAFDEVMFHLDRGDSYLLNLTMPVKLFTNLQLFDIFQLNNAPYKLWMKDKFTVFSPEPFVKISQGKIFSHPMKGTIDADLPDAEKQLLADPKELAEHYTIVDLIRNDLNIVSSEVQVDLFRYIEKIHTHRKNLLQTSSVISGRLPEDYTTHIGTIITKLLPAGSVSGAPKKRTTEIILEAERYNRGYYTGIFGIFDGINLDSGVMIRFIEQTESGLFFKAGGGITVQSKVNDEYNELLDKVYLPFTG